ncbi:MAG: hypothetical protein RLZZ308_498 [Candidatus Parcubacteria bacterium]|jgi:uncharacterized membrane protein (UPF0127 family)
MKKIQPTKVLRTISFVLLLVGLFFSTMYGFKCFLSHVCEVPVFEKWIRHDVTVLMPKGALQVEVANTYASRELGLSGRDSMTDDEGLLFVFDHPGRYGFWMKDMKFALDIIWINHNGVVVWVERNVEPSSYPSTFINQADASYVLEINKGLAEKFDLYLGSKVKITE